MKRTILSLAGIILFIAAIRIPLLGIPFERDEGEYAYIAWRSGFGELPYRDWIDQKPPGIFWAYQLALQLPLDAVRAVHLLGLIVVAAAACAVYFLACRLTKPFWALVCAILFGCLSTDPLVQGTAANTELFLSLPLLLALLATLSVATENRRLVLLALLAGGLTGIAMAFKQIAIFYWPLLIISHWLFAARAERLRKTLIFAAGSAAGLTAIWILIAGWFAMHHGLNDFIYNVFTHNLEYIQVIPWATRLGYCRHTLQSLAGSQALIWLFAGAALIALWKTKRKRYLWFLAGWLLAGLAGTSASGYYFPHYFQPLIPVLCLAAALGAEMLEAAPFWKSAPVMARQWILVVALAALPVAELSPFEFVYSPREAVRAIYPGNEALFAEMPELGKHLAQSTRPDDQVFVFGAEPELLFYARRVSATRYIFLFPLYGPYSDAHAKQVETASEVSAHQPAAALYMPNGLFFIPGADQFLTRWTRTYLRDNFQMDTYLTKDEGNVIHLVPVTADPSCPKPNDPRIIGALLLRKNQ